MDASLSSHRGPLWGFGGKAAQKVWAIDVHEGKNEKAL